MPVRDGWTDKRVRYGLSVHFILQVLVSPPIPTTACYYLDGYRKSSVPMVVVVVVVGQEEKKKNNNNNTSD